MLADKNITTLALEVPTSCLVSGNDPVIGGWTTASVKDKNKDWDWDKSRFDQVSRLGSPLVNELVIGIKDKDRFNGSEPKNDGQFATYVTNPTLPGPHPGALRRAGACARRATIWCRCS